MRAAVAGRTVVFSGPLAPGLVAYVDGDALPGTGEAGVEALVVAAGSDEPSVLATLLGPVRAAVGDGTQPVEVIGGGVVAAMLRSALPAPTGAAQPACVVDRTGRPESIALALVRVADRGTVVIAGGGTGTCLDVDIYPDLHRRSLRLVGVPAPRALAAAGPSLEARVAPATEATIGTPAPAGASWYRISPGTSSVG